MHNENNSGSIISLLFLVFEILFLLLFELIKFGKISSNMLTTLTFMALSIIFTTSIFILSSVLFRKTLTAFFVLFGYFVLSDIANLGVWGLLNPVDANSYTQFALRKASGFIITNPTFEQLPISWPPTFTAIVIFIFWITVTQIACLIVTPRDYK